MSNEPDFEERLREVREEAEKAENPPIHYRLDATQQKAGLAAAFILTALLGIWIYAGIYSPPLTILVGIGVGTLGSAITWMYITASGVAFRTGVKEAMEQQNSEGQQQQQAGHKSSDPTVVCQNCGWQNPKKNNYCHDCGSEI